MKLKEFLDDLNEKVKLDPKLLELEVVASSDDEGNWYNSVYFTASTGNFDNGEFVPESDFKDCGFKKSDLNAICVN